MELSQYYKNLIYVGVERNIACYDVDAPEARLTEHLLQLMETNFPLISHKNYDPVAPSTEISLDDIYSLPCIKKFVIDEGSRDNCTWFPNFFGKTIEIVPGITKYFGELGAVKPHKKKWIIIGVGEDFVFDKEKIEDLYKYVIIGSY